MEVAHFFSYRPSRSHVFQLEQQSIQGMGGRHSDKPPRQIGFARYHGERNVSEPIVLILSASERSRLSNIDPALTHAAFGQGEVS